jgi:FtsZ-binding cell division protein ZapB
MLLLLNVVGLVGIAALVWCWRLLGNVAERAKHARYWRDEYMKLFEGQVVQKVSAYNILSQECERLKAENSALKQDRDNLGRDKCNLTAECEALCEQVAGLSEDLALSNAKYDCVCEVLEKVNKAKSKSKKCACKSKGKK